MNNFDIDHTDGVCLEHFYKSSNPVEWYTIQWILKILLVINFE